MEVEDVSVAYGRGDAAVHALRGVSFAVGQGEFVVIRGRSGSGKTTLLQVLAGLRRPTSGRVRVAGADLHALRESACARLRRRRIGVVHQFFNLVPTLLVEHNAALPLLLDGEPLARVRPRVNELLERLGLGGYGARRTTELSGGEMQRVAIARALVARPEVVLADEPTGNLDSATGESVLQLFRELCRERGASLLMVTHDAEASAFAERVIALADGRVVDDGARIRDTRAHRARAGCA